MIIDRREVPAGRNVLLNEGRSRVGSDRKPQAAGRIASRWLCATLACAGLAAAWSGAALAQARPGAPATEPGFLSEIRGGLLVNDAALFGSKKEHGADLNLELLFVSPTLAPFRWIGSPRPHLGFSGNLDGYTSKAYGGLTWEWDFWGQFFAGGSLGFAWHDGKTSTLDTDRKELGSKWLFRESLSLGVRFGSRLQHNASVMLDHISNAGIADKNDGLDTVGLRYGIRF